MDNNNITGDISVSTTLPSVLVFNLKRTNVYGDLSSLKTYKSRYISIDNTQVTGDIANLSNMSDKHSWPEYCLFMTKNKLNWSNNSPDQYVYIPLSIELTYTSCYGNISVFANKDVGWLYVNKPGII